MHKTKNRAGFTLIELLIVIAIIAIIAAVVFVALNPAVRLRDARDASRYTDITALLSAIKTDQVDNGGAYHADVPSLVANTVHMLGTCTTGATAVGITGICDTNPTEAACVNLTTTSTTNIVDEGYIGSIPISPDGDSTASWGASMTGYTLEHDTGGIIHIRACESENTTEISVSR